MKTPTRKPSNEPQPYRRGLVRRRACALVLTLGTLGSIGVAQPAIATVGDARQEVQRVVDELDRLQEQADILAEDYNEAIDNKAQLDAEITKLEAKVAGKQADLTAVQNDISEVAMRAFTGADDSDLMGPLFGSTESYSNSLRRDQLSRVALNAGTGTTDDLDVLIGELNDEQKQLDAKRTEAAQLAEKIKEKQAGVQSRTEEYKKKRAEAEAALGQAIAEEEARRAEAARNQMLAQQRAAAAAAARPNSAAAGTPAVGGGNAGGGQAGGGNANGGQAPSAAPAAPAAPAAAAAPAPAPAPAPSKPAYSSPSVSGLAGVAVNAAMNQQGKPYVYATAGPDSFDCSGLTSYAWGQAGVGLPRNSRAQFAALPHVDPADAQPGDLIFFYSPISHVGIYLGGGQMVHAPNSGSSVKVSSVSWNKVTGVGRPG